jgi:hypothetical protein
MAKHRNPRAHQDPPPDDARRVAPKRRRTVASAARAEETRRRIAEQNLRAAVGWFQALQGGRGARAVASGAARSPR